MTEFVFSRPKTALRLAALLTVGPFVFIGSGAFDGLKSFVALCRDVPPALAYVAEPAVAQLKATREKTVDTARDVAWGAAAFWDSHVLNRLAAVCTLAALPAIALFAMGKAIYDEGIFQEFPGIALDLAKAIWTNEAVY